MTIEYLKSKSVTKVYKEDEAHLLIDEDTDKGKVKFKPLQWQAKNVTRKFGMKIYKAKEIEKIIPYDTLPESAIIIDSLDTFKDLNI